MVQTRAALLCSLGRPSREGQGIASEFENMWRQAGEGQFGGHFVALSPGEAQQTRQAGFEIQTPMSSLYPPVG